MWTAVYHTPRAQTESVSIMLTKQRVYYHFGETMVEPSVAHLLRGLQRLTEAYWVIGVRQRQRGRVVYREPRDGVVLV